MLGGEDGMTNEEDRNRVLRMAADRGDFIRCDDGYLGYWPTKNNGYLTAIQLRWIADYLDFHNRNWDEEIKQELSK